MPERSRRRWTAAEKMRIVLEGMQAGVEIADLCRREGINPTMFYFWKRQLVGSAGKVFDGQGGRRPAQEVRREAEVQRLKNVIAEITAENVELKKGLSG
jgi:transposase